MDPMDRTRRILAGFAVCLGLVTLTARAQAGSDGEIECQFVPGVGVECWYPDGAEATRDEAQEVIDELKAERAAARAERNAEKAAAEAAAAEAIAAAEEAKDQAIAEAAAVLAATEIAAAQAAAEAAIAAAEAAAPTQVAAAAQAALDAAEAEAREAEEAEEEAAREAAEVAENLTRPRPNPTFVAARPQAKPDSARPRIFGTTWDARVQVVAAAETWVVITDGDGNEIYSGFVRPQDTILIPNRDDIVMTAANAGALNIMVDGTALTRSNTGARVASNVSLAVGNLLGLEFLADVEKEPNRILVHEAP